MQRLINILTLFLSGAAIASGIGLILILTLLDPSGSKSNIALFYLGLVVLIFSVGTLAGFFLRRRLGQRERAKEHYQVSARQGLWFAILVAISLMLESYNVFNLINAGLLVLTLIFLESYFLYK